MWRPERLTALIALLLPVAQAWGADKTSPGTTSPGLFLSEKHDDSFLGVEFSTSLLTLKAPKASVLGAAVRIGTDASVTPKVAAGIAFSQAVSLSSPSLLFSALELNLSYAITGSFRKRKSSYRVEGYDVAQIDEQFPGGWRAQAYFNQLFLNGSTGVVSFNGPGIGATYEWPTFEERSLGVNARGDFLTGNGVSIQVLRLAFTYTIRY